MLSIYIDVTDEYILLNFDFQVSKLMHAAAFRRVRHVGGGVRLPLPAQHRSAGRQLERPRLAGLLHSRGHRLWYYFTF